MIINLQYNLINKSVNLNNGKFGEPANDHVIQNHFHFISN